LFTKAISVGVLVIVLVNRIFAASSTEAYVDVLSRSPPNAKLPDAAE